MSDRKEYIDIAKGILIALVVIHHIASFAVIEYQTTNVVFYEMKEVIYTYVVPFFMPAFFVITGYVTNFDKYDFRTFLYRNCATLLLPCWLFSALAGGLWFLEALFVAKLLYWCINAKAESDTLRMIIVIGVSLFGVFCHAFFNHDYISLFHSLELLVFLEMGRRLDSINIHIKTALISTSIILSTLYYVKNTPPVCRCKF